MFTVGNLKEIKDQQMKMFFLNEMAFKQTKRVRFFSSHIFPLHFIKKKEGYSVCRMEMIGRPCSQQEGNAKIIKYIGVVGHLF